MPGTKSDYLRAQFFNVVLRAGAAWKPPGVWLGLYLANPTDAGGGIEVSSGNYGRIQIPQTNEAWTVPSGVPLQCSNTTALSWVGITWSGIITGWGLFEAQVAGNMCYWSDCTDKVMQVGGTVIFPVGSLIVQER